jgi:hypothetical protein
MNYGEKETTSAIGNGNSSNSKAIHPVREGIECRSISRFYSFSHGVKVREQLMLPFYQYMPPTITALTSERLGTFQDNLRAPIHRWFKYPAGFSYKLVEALIENYKLNAASWLLDPFVGNGGRFSRLPRAESTRTWWEMEK